MDRPCAKSKKRLVLDFNELITCKLCNGYLVNATTLVECLHSFCRGCLLRHFESSKTHAQCPVCLVLYKKKSQCFRTDVQLQALVYKIVPSLYTKEMQRREDFYRSTGVRAGSACSDDSVIDRERDLCRETEEMIAQYVGDRTQYLSQEEHVSLSLEYYQVHLDTAGTTVSTVADRDQTVENNNNNNNNQFDDGDVGTTDGGGTTDASESKNGGDKRYLRCPAGVSVRHLQKFVRMKFGLTSDHNVDIIYKGEVLPVDFTLLDVVYTFHWKRKKPMRFFYRIFTPLKIRPIKIVNTPTPTGEKQLQIVPVTAVGNRPETAAASTPTTPTTGVVAAVETPPKRPSNSYREETESERQDKEHLLANLQLQSKSKALLQQQQQQEAKKTAASAVVVKECVYEYEEPDQEEIKRFAEKRDREWAMQKKLEEETDPERSGCSPDKSASGYTSKKRKRNKHSKNESNGHKEKKRKLHAEITNNDKSDLKLKVKITNGHKHKHHKIESGGGGGGGTAVNSGGVAANTADLSHKEKLLQMRQVRHKHAPSGSGDEKSAPTVPIIKLVKPIPNNQATSEDVSTEPKKRKEAVVSSSNDPPKTVDAVVVSVKPVEPQAKPPLPSTSRNLPQTPATAVQYANSKVIKKDQQPPIKPAKTVTFDQKTFVKSVAAAIPSGDKQPAKLNSNNKLPNHKPLSIGAITTNNKSLDRKIANLQQRCTIEAKKPSQSIAVAATPKCDTNNKTSSSGGGGGGGGNTTGGKLLTPQYPSSFTVSKIEGGLKRKAPGDPKEPQDKRPSLEITLIPQSTTSTSTPKSGGETKPPTKRPPPGTIPLEKIKNVVNHSNSGISIFPKMAAETSGVLDLSKASAGGKVSEPINGLSSMVNRQMAQRSIDTKNVQLANLQMLSKVAIEHQNLNKVAPAVTPAPLLSKPKPPLPSLQTIGGGSKGSAQTTQTPTRPASLHRMMPKLNNIQPKFTPSGAQIRTVRPNQNQNIRNIPNPSLVLNRHQNMGQGRVQGSSTGGPASAPQNRPQEKKVTTSKPSPVPQATAAAVAAAAAAATTAVSSSTAQKDTANGSPTTNGGSDQKGSEVKEVSV